MLQLVYHDGRQDLTKNLEPNLLLIETLLNEGYANLLIERQDETITVKITKQGAIQVHRAKNQEAVEIDLNHDRKKSRMLPVSDPVFIALGISTRAGELIPKQSDKYRQVDDFLRIIESIYDQLGDGQLTVVDLGCGNAYLTFAVQRFLALKGRDVKVVGVDNKVQSRERNSKIAAELSLESSMEFVASDIAKFAVRPVNLVIALHACDTATDDALAWAIKSSAKSILVSPCCHHELNRRIQPSEEYWQPIFRHGIVKERFADLLTDSIRAELLRINGYRAEIIEFVSVDHTPRNLMIRAVFTGVKADPGNYQSLCQRWSLDPYLATLLS